MKDISAIIINYNSSAFTLNCVKSIFEKTASHISFQKVVADNASKTDEYYILRNVLKSLNSSLIKLVRSPYKTCFGGGHKYGVQFANVRHYAFFNNDTILKRFIYFKGQSTAKISAIKKELKISLLYVLRKNSGYLSYQILRWWLTLKVFFKLLIAPKIFHIFLLYLKGALISDSLKQKQTIAP